MYEKERMDLTDLLRKKGINSDKVLDAVNSVERHLFIPNVIGHHAYKDTALPIGYGQTISQPYTVAFMTEKLNLEPGNKVLEIGTGSGYQAAIFLHSVIREAILSVVSISADSTAAMKAAG